MSVCVACSLYVLVGSLLPLNEWKLLLLLGQMQVPHSHFWFALTQFQQARIHAGWSVLATGWLPKGRGCCDHPADPWAAREHPILLPGFNKKVPARRRHFQLHLQDDQELCRAGFSLNTRAPRWKGNCGGEYIHSWTRHWARGGESSVARLVQWECPSDLPGGCMPALYKPLSPRSWPQAQMSYISLCFLNASSSAFTPALKLMYLNVWRNALLYLDQTSGAFLSGLMRWWVHASTLLTHVWSGECVRSRADLFHSQDLRISLSAITSRCSPLDWAILRSGRLQVCLWDATVCLCPFPETGLPLLSTSVQQAWFGSFTLTCPTGQTQWEAGSQSYLYTVASAAVSETVSAHP